MSTNRKPRRHPKDTSSPTDINAPTLAGRLLTARRDTVDFRDKMFVPTLVEVPESKSLDSYLECDPWILDQGEEGACTGFGLAAVANYLLATRIDGSEFSPVSPRMLYEMAKRHDEWPGEDYSGSSARGAMKGWHKYGVCSEETWPYYYGYPDRNLTHERLEDSRNCPLGAYFRVNHRDLVAMHSAITETGILYATSLVHKGWQRVPASGRITYHPEAIGGHAFAVVGYDREGFWLQNSWGIGWGSDGFAHLSYADWLENGSDVWVARVGVPVSVGGASQAYSATTFPGTEMSQSSSLATLRPHIVSLGNDGKPLESGDFGNTAVEIRELIRTDFPRNTGSWSKKRILLYAHGGLVGEKGAVQRIAEYRQLMLPKEIYPLAFVWHSDFWSTLKNILGEAFRSRRAEGPIDSAKDFLLDRLDDTLEPIARAFGGRAQWSEMKENALAATESAAGGGRIVLRELKRLMASDPDIEIHVAGHSAGSIFMAPVVREISRFSSIQTCHLWAPACTTDLFKRYYQPLLGGAGRAIREFALYSLTDTAERDDHCARIYHKSLLYLVSRAFEDDYKPWQWGWKGAPILGMARFIDRDPAIKRIFAKKSATWAVAPNNSANPLLASKSTRHGGFDDDEATVEGLVHRILGSKTATSAAPHFLPSAASSRSRRSEWTG